MTTPTSIVKAVAALDRAIEELRSCASQADLFVRICNCRGDLLGGTIPADVVGRRLQILIDCYGSIGAPWWASLRQAAEALEAPAAGIGSYSPGSTDPGTGSYNGGEGVASYAKSAPSAPVSGAAIADAASAPGCTAPELREQAARVIREPGRTRYVSAAGVVGRTVAHAPRDLPTNEGPLPAGYEVPDQCVQLAPVVCVGSSLRLHPTGKAGVVTQTHYADGVATLKVDFGRGVQ